MHDTAVDRTTITTNTTAMMVVVLFIEGTGPIGVVEEDVESVYNRGFVVSVPSLATVELGTAREYQFLVIAKLVDGKDIIIIITYNDTGNHHMHRFKTTCC